MRPATTVSSCRPTRDGAHEVTLGHDDREPHILHHEDHSRLRWNIRCAISLLDRAASTVSNSVDM
jgi:hypothetical protein